ncbi:MAG: DUF3782 domain-containing protein [Candidatus Freyarchaeota archaeon]|nr:DUF3782 domain-containing protein [Candidatus Freyarchaeota archaeon]
MTVSKDELRKILLELLKTDGDLRAEVYSIVVEAFPTKREMEALTDQIRELAEKIAKQTETLQRNIEETAKRTERFEEEMRKSREETAKRMDSFEKSLELMSKRMDSFEEEMKKLREDMSKRMDSFEKSLELMSKRMDSFEKSLELMSKRMDSFEEEMKRHREELRVLIGGLGARWGFAAEEAFREGIRGILGEMGYVVERWEVFDEEGVVFDSPAVVEADVLVRDEKHVLIEVRSSVGRSDVASFIRKAKLYEKLTSIKPALAIVSPFVDENAKEYALRKKIKVYTRVREFKPI